MRLAAIPILLLPMVMFTWLLLATQSDHTFHSTLYNLSLLSGFVCLAWGFVLIYSRSRVLGCLCIGVALICLGVLLWPFFFSGVKTRANIIFYETLVV